MKINSRYLFCGQPDRLKTAQEPLYCQVVYSLEQIRERSVKFMLDF